MPLRFEPAAPGHAETFVARGAGYLATIHSAGAVLPAGAGTPGEPPVQLHFIGARTDAPGRGESRRASISNYVFGPDPAGWRLAVPHFERVRYTEIYPGIDVLFYSAHDELEYDFVVAPGADPSRIRLVLVGMAAAALDASGDLVVQQGTGTVRQRRPVAYQERHGRREPVGVQYVPRDDGTLGVEVESFDRSRPLVIDPVIEYSTLFGGTANDLGADVAVDAAGAVYVTGHTFSGNLPVNAGDTTHNGGNDVFVAKFTNTGALAWSTFYGGTGDEYADGLALGNGAVYVVGATDGTVPLGATPFDGTRAGDWDPIVARFDPASGVLTAATLLGGSDDAPTLGAFADQAWKVTVDPAGAVIVVGNTAAANFPTSVNGFDRTFNGVVDGFVVALNATLSTLQYGTYLGGSDQDRAVALALAPGTSTVYVTGQTLSANFPTTPGAFDVTHNGDWDVFVTRLPLGGPPTYSTFLGGPSFEFGSAVAVDVQGRATVAGYTASTTYPTAGAFADTTFNGFVDVFVTRLEAGGNALVYSTFRGGSNSDYAWDLAIDDAGAAYITGRTLSPNFTSTGGAFSSRPFGGSDAYLLKLGEEGWVQYASYLGTTGYDEGVELGFGPGGLLYLTGLTATTAGSTAFPVTGNGFDLAGNGADDAFLLRFASAFDAHVRRNDQNPRAIPAAGSVDSTIAVNTPGTDGTIESLTVSVYVTHTYNADLSLSLIAPDGTTVPLTSGIGGSSDNYGAACQPESQRTTFDDAAAAPISSGSAPFVGTFRPLQPLSIFQGGYLSNLQGTWRLRASDAVTADTGTVQCWALNIRLESPAVTGISPAAGSVAGGTSITVTGRNFAAPDGEPSPPSVVIGGVPLSISTWTDTSVSGTIGARFAGPADVTVVDGHARSGVLTSGFTYQGSQTLTVAVGGTGAGTVGSTPAGISGCSATGGDCIEGYSYGTQVTLTATPASGSTFTGWSGAGCSGTGTCVVSMTQARNVTATFTLIQYTLTVTRAGSGTGTVTSSPAGITCGADCSEPYNYNTQVTLSATPATGSSFTGWSGEGCSGTGTCVVSMTQARNVTATFTADPGTLTVTRAGSGTGTVTSSPPGINCGADCSEPYPFNTQVTLTATPATGSTFTGWSGEGCSGTGTCVVSMTQARAVTATFASQNAPTIETRTPDRGSTRGGTLVLLTGTNFVDGTSVRVGTETVTALRRGTTELSFLTPAAPAGMRTITVQTPTGNATVSFEFVAPTIDTRTGWRRPSYSVSRYTAFESLSPLLPEDTNGVADIYVHDDVTDTVRRVSVSSSGAQASGGESRNAAISPSGRFVAFESRASNLVAGDTNGAADVFLHDRDSDDDGIFDELGASSTIRVSVSSTGGQALGGGSTLPSLSGTGRYTAFQSAATTLVPGDDNGAIDIFVHDRLTGRTTRVSVASDGTAGIGHSMRAAISQNGRHVAFDSSAVLTAGDTNGARDVFVHDRDVDGDGILDEPGAVATRRVSVSTDGAQAVGGDSTDPSITADGRYVAFASGATSLVAGDTNGQSDVFIHDRDASANNVLDEPGDIRTRRLSVGPAGAQLAVGSRAPRISANGALLVCLVSEATASSGAANSADLAAGLVVGLPLMDGKSTPGRIPDPTSPEPPPIVVEPPDPGETQEDVNTDPNGTRSGGTVGPAPGQPGPTRVDTTTEPDYATPAPFITALTPPLGPAAGGTLVVIEGVNLTGTVLWNGTPIAPISATARRVEVFAPAQGGGPARADVRVRSAEFLSNHVSFAYVPVLSTPRWTGHAPSSGIVTGGASVTITGTGFDRPVVHLGRRPAPVTAWTTTTVTVDVPASGEAGPVPVILANADGAEAVSGQPFTYQNATSQPLTMSGVRPQIGPTSGGTAVTIAGTGFLPGTTVTFSGVAARSVQLLSSSTLIVETPPAAPGPAALVVTVPGQPAASTTFQYAAIESVTPCGGPDQDGDGMPDEWERAYGLSQNDGADATEDPDGDGRTNVQECGDGTHPRGMFSRYLAEGATGTFFDTRIVVANPGSTPAHVLLRFQTDTGATPSASLVIPAESRRFYYPAQGLSELVSASFSTVIESDVEVVVDRSMFWGAGIYGSHAESSVAAPGTTWYLAEGATHGNFDLFYLLQNPSSSDALVRVRYLRTSGAPVERTYVVHARRRLTILVDAIPELAAADVSAVFTSMNAVPIIVERAMYRTNDPGRPFESGHNSAAVAAPSTSWFLAEGATGTFFDTFVLLANPNDAAADVVVRYLLPGGATVTKTYLLQGNTRRTIWVAGEDPQLAATSVSTVVTVTNAVPIIVERAMWWPGLQAQQSNPALFPVFWGEGHNSPGATQTGTRWAVADGETGPDPVMTRTYYLIANTSPRAARVRVRLLSETDQPPIERTFTVAANSRFTVPVADLFPEAAAGTPYHGFAAVIDSLADGGLPPAEIVVERAMYSNVNGIFWAAGTNLLATRLR